MLCWQNKMYIWFKYGLYMSSLYHLQVQVPEDFALSLMTFLTFSSDSTIDNRK